MNYGYARVSTTKQELDTQLEKLRNADCEKIFQEKITGTKKDGREELQKMMNLLKQGDIVKITKIDRLARSIPDLRDLIKEMHQKGVAVEFLDNNLSFKPNGNDPMQKLMLNMLGSFAEFERDLIVSRTQEGKAYAKKHDKNFKDGRPKRLLTPQYLHAIELLETNSYNQVEKKTGISKSTLQRIKKQYLQEMTNQNKKE
jgi:DNA invertase Pin-like site-specific DNA recombinase